MKLPTLYLIRHGLATLSKTGYGDQVLSAELLPQGLPAVERMAEFMAEQPYTQGFRSELRRCQQTATKVSERSARAFQPDPRLNEYNAESFTAFVARVTSFWNEIKDQEDEVIWICTHGAVISTLNQLYFSKPVTEAALLEYPSTGEIWIFKDDHIIPKDFNQGGLKG